MFNRRKNTSKRLSQSGIALVAIMVTHVAMSAPTQAFNPVDTAQKDINVAIKADQKAQKQVVKILEESNEIRGANMNLRLQIPMLELEEKKLKRYCESLEKKNADLRETQRRYQEIALVLENELVEVVDLLREQIEADRPFLHEEREKRLVFLMDSLNDTQLSIGEKFRRVAEALNVEADYGMTYEVKTEINKLDDQETPLSVIRLGRVGLFAITLDQKTVGIWSEKKKTFVSNPEYLQSIKTLAQSVQNKVITDLVMVPVETK